MAAESWLCLDYGSKRIGLAHADEVGVPLPLEAATGPTEEERLARIGAVIEEKRVGGLVVGHPTRPDGSAGPIAREAEAFARRLGERFGLPVALADERHSSNEAGAHWNLKKARRRRASGRLDSAAAAVILRRFLEERESAAGTAPPPEPPPPEDSRPEPRTARR